MRMEAIPVSETFEICSVLQNTGQRTKSKSPVIPKFLTYLKKLIKALSMSFLVIGLEQAKQYPMALEPELVSKVAGCAV
jgi:hypothetical protein